MNYYIFGAHSRGQTMGVYLKKLHDDWNNLGYLYDDDQINPETVRGVPVFKIQGEQEIDVSATIYIATRGSSFAHVKEVLEEYGFSPDNIMPVDVELDSRLRNEFVPEYFREQKREFIRLENLLDLCGNAHESAGRNVDTKIYVVRSAADSDIMSVVPLCNDESFIQAGRALSDTALSECDYYDNTGDNISTQNKQMCELTAMYWIWKNVICAKIDVVGLEHYRRRFILPKNWKNAFVFDKADVILPVPLFVNPSIMGNYVDRHERKPWDSMMRHLKRIHGQDVYESARDFFENTGCYSPCNMLIARGEAFAAVCEFVFPVIFAVMEECGTIEDNYQNRYPGFLSERLITYYFHRNVDRFRICYADKSFLI